MYLAWNVDGTCMWQATATWQKESPHGMHLSDSHDAMCIPKTLDWLEWVSQNLAEKIWRSLLGGYKLNKLTRKGSSTYWILSIILV